MPSYPFVTLDVFTDTRYLGNPLGVVHIPHSAPKPAQDEKQRIAKEFNLSETVFIHDPPPDSNANISYEGKEVEIDIFLTEGEIPFAGHPTIGSTYHLLTSSNDVHGKEASLTLLTKAGKVPATLEQGRARLEVPHSLTIHDTSIDIALAARCLGIDYNPSNGSIIPNSADGTGVAAVSLVKGVSFAVVHVGSLDTLQLIEKRSFKLLPSDIGLPDNLNGFVAIYAYYVVREDEQNRSMELRTRMMEGSFEDPATGAAASALAGFLGITTDSKIGKGGERRKYIITQGVEMGRKSDIEVEVETAADGSAVNKIWLSGRAVQVMKGEVKL